MFVKVKAMNGRKLHMTNLNFSQAIVHILNLLTDVTMCHCSFYQNVYLKVRIHSVYSCMPNKKRVLKVRRGGFFPKFDKWDSFNKQIVSKQDNCAKKFMNLICKGVFSTSLCSAFTSSQLQC